TPHCSCAPCTKSVRWRGIPPTPHTCSRSGGGSFPVASERSRQPVRRRPVMRLHVAIALGSVLVGLCARTGWSATITMRPQQTRAVSNVANPANAIDDNQGTFATVALRRVCRDDHSQPQSATVTFDAFKTGYRPVRLEVAWNASAMFAVMGANTAS